VELFKLHANVLMIQMSMRAGIKKFGEKGNESLMKELRQLHNRKEMVPKRMDELSTDDRKKAFRYLMFIKEKRDSTVKARGCTDSQPQCNCTQKEDASLPTVSLEAMMLSCAIDAKEGRYGVVTDVPGAVLHAIMTDPMHMVLEGTIAKHIAKLEPTIYRNTYGIITKERGCSMYN